jgi:AraC-like DNA-binding protein
MDITSQTGSIEFSSSFIESAVSQVQSLPFEFQLLGTVQAIGMRAEVRLFSRSPADRHVWTALRDILTFRFAPRNVCWPRSSSWETKSNGAPVLHVMAAFDKPLSAAAQYEHGPCIIDDLSMIEMMRLLHDEIRSPGFASTAMVESISELLRIKLCRLGKKSDDDSAAQPAGFGKADIGLIHEYIEAQSGRSPSVTELAKLFDMSRRSLLRRFKNATSMTVASYITHVQVAKAKRLLATSGCLTPRCPPGQNQRSRTQRPSPGRSSKLSRPSKWSIVRFAIASGGASLTLTAMRRRPSDCNRKPRHAKTQAHAGQNRISSDGSALPMRV